MSIFSLLGWTIPLKSVIQKMSNTKTFYIAAYTKWLQIQCLRLIVCLCNACWFLYTLFFPNQSLLYLLWSALTWQLCSCIKGWPNYSLFTLVSRVRTPFTRVLWQRWSTQNMRASNGRICPSPSNTVCRTIQEERKSWSSLFVFLLFLCLCF